jgi:hypothetical protein
MRCRHWQVWLAALWLALWTNFTVAETLLAYPAGFQEILAGQTREIKVYSYSGGKDIYLFDMPSLESQGRMFNRVVALVEKLGVPRDRVFTNEELAAYIKSTGRTEATFAFGNDFQVHELVLFFNLANDGKIDLTDEEKLLLDFLVDNQFMVLKFGFYQLAQPDRVVLSIPQEEEPATPSAARVTPLARHTILRHELSHAEFFTNAAYANYCRSFWHNVMSETERTQFKNFLSTNAYDQNNTEMMVNEMQAYLMHTPDPGAFNPAKVKMTAQQVMQLRKKFLGGNPPTRLFEDMPAFF